MNAPQPGADTRPLAGPRVSVLVELDNLKRTRLERVHEALRALGREIAALDDPLEVLVGSPGASPQAWVVDLVRTTGLEAASRGHRCRVVPVGDRRYYEIKNHLAEHATGEILVFADCDVVPDAGWLSTLLAPLDDPVVEVACSQVRVGPLSGFSARAIAATWIFEPSRRGGVEPATTLYANSVAFRASRFATHPFPSAPEEFRGACATLARQLAAEGVRMVRVNDAVVWHPPLALPAEAVVWSLLAGRDRAIRWQHLPPAEFWSTGLAWVGEGTVQAVKAAWARRRVCGLGPVGALGAAVVGAGMWAARFAGLAISRFRPALLAPLR